MEAGNDIATLSAVWRWIPASSHTESNCQETWKGKTWCSSVTRIVWSVGRRADSQVCILATRSPYTVITGIWTMWFRGGVCWLNHSNRAVVGYLLSVCKTLGSTFRNLKEGGQGVGRGGMLEDAGGGKGKGCNYSIISKKYFKNYDDVEMSS